MDTTYRKNLKAVLTASKSYTDNSIEKLKWELGTYDLSITTDSTTAYTKTIPTNAIKGRINYIGGASKVSENLIVLNDVAETTENGITYKIENGIIYLISGTATINKNIRATTFTLPAGTYYFKSFGTTGSNSTYFSYLQAPIESGTLIRYSYDNKSFTLSEETEVQYIWAVRGGVSVSNLQFKDMLVRGSTAPTEFKVGFEGMRSAKTTSVKFEGANLFDKDTYTYTNGKSINDNGEIINNSSSWRVIEYYMPIQENTTYTLSGTAIGTQDWGTRIAFYDKNHNQISQTRNLGIVNIYTFTTPSGTRYWRYSWAVVNDTSDWILNRGSTALPYVPYIAPITKQIPSEVQALEGYGLGLNDSVYNYIDFENKKFIFNTNKITITSSSTYSWISSTYNACTILLPTYKASRGVSGKAVGNDNIANIIGDQNNSLYITFSNAYSSEEELKNAMLNVIVVYQLATPIETDISQYIDDDFKNIDITNMGTITFENEFGYDVPSEIDYLIEEVKA